MPTKDIEILPGNHVRIRATRPGVAETSEHLDSFWVDFNFPCWFKEYASNLGNALWVYI